MAIPLRRADPANVQANERTFFISSATWGKRSLLQSRRAAELFLEVLYHYRREGKYRLHEFVVMPDHIHLLITLDRDMTVEKAVQLIKGGFAEKIKEESFSTRARWQYIHDNPVARGLCQRPGDYDYSSARPGTELDPPPEWLRLVGRASA